MAVVLDSSVNVLLDNLAATIKGERGIPPVVKSELRALQRKAERLRSLLADAPSTKCLAELRDAVYDADDVVDDCGADGDPALQRGVEARIRDINAWVEDIARDMSLFQLVAAGGAAKRRSARLSRETSSLVESDIVGVAIEMHARCLIKFLTEDGSQSLAAITGMGGIGKTTLA